MSGINLNLPVSNDGQTVRIIYLSLPEALSRVEWERFRTMLDVLEPGLVTDEPAAARTEETTDAH